MERDIKGSLPIAGKQNYISAEKIVLKQTFFYNAITTILKVKTVKLSDASSYLRVLKDFFAKPYIHYLKLTVTNILTTFS